MRYVLAMLSAILLVSCAKNEDGPATHSPQAATASGCQLDKRLDIGSDTLLHGMDNLLVLGQLSFDKMPTGLALGGLQSLELHLFEQALDATSGKYPGGFVGYRLTDPMSPFKKGSTPLTKLFGSALEYNNRNASGGRVFTAKIGSDPTPEWKMEAVMIGNDLAAVEVSYQVAQSSGTPMIETLCVKSAKVLKPF